MLPVASLAFRWLASLWRIAKSSHPKSLVTTLFPNPINHLTKGPRNRLLRYESRREIIA